MNSDYTAAGIFSLAMSVYNMFSPIAQYRIYTYQVSDVNRKYSMGNYLAMRILTSIITLVGIILYSALTINAATAITITLYSIFKLSGLLIDILHGENQLQHRMDLTGISYFIQGMLFLIAFIVVYQFTNSLNLALIIMTVSTIAAGALFDLKATARFQRITIEFDKKAITSLLVECAPAVIAGIACSAASSIPRQYLSSYAGSAALGAYSSAAAPIAIVQMGASYIYNPLLSYFAESYTKGEKTTFLKLFIKTLAGIALVGVVCSIGMSVFGEKILVFVFGTTIKQYAYLLQPLVICAIFTGTMWFLNDLLIALRSFRATLISSILSLIASLIAMVPMIAVFSLNGVTITNIIACSTSIVFMLYCLFTIFRNRFKTSKEKLG